jgi:hypothetical protein
MNYKLQKYSWSMAAAAATAVYIKLDSMLREVDANADTRCSMPNASTIWCGLKKNEWNERMNQWEDRRSTRTFRISTKFSIVIIVIIIIIIIIIINHLIILSPAKSIISILVKSSCAHAAAQLKCAHYSNPIQNHIKHEYTNMLYA